MSQAVKEKPQKQRSFTPTARTDTRVVVRGRSATDVSVPTLPPLRFLEEGDFEDDADATPKHKRERDSETPNDDNNDDTVNNHSSTVTSTSSFKTKKTHKRRKTPGEESGELQEQIDPGTTEAMSGADSGSSDFDSDQGSGIGQGIANRLISQSAEAVKQSDAEKEIARILKKQEKSIAKANTALVHMLRRSEEAKEELQIALRLARVELARARDLAEENDKEARKEDLSPDMNSPASGEDDSLSSAEVKSLKDKIRRQNRKISQLKTALKYDKKDMERRDIAQMEMLRTLQSQMKKIQELEARIAKAQSRGQIIEESDPEDENTESLEGSPDTPDPRGLRRGSSAFFEMLSAGSGKMVDRAQPAKVPPLRIVSPLSGPLQRAQLENSAPQARRRSASTDDLPVVPALKPRPSHLVVQQASAMPPSPRHSTPPNFMSGGSAAFAGISASAEPLSIMTYEQRKAKRRTMTFDELDLFVEQKKTLRQTTTNNHGNICLRSDPDRPPVTVLPQPSCSASQSVESFLVPEISNNNEKEEKKEKMSKKKRMRFLSPSLGGNSVKVSRSMIGSAVPIQNRSATLSVPLTSAHPPQPSSARGINTGTPPMMQTRKISKNENTAMPVHFSQLERRQHARNMQRDQAGPMSVMSKFEHLKKEFIETEETYIQGLKLLFLMARTAREMNSISREEIATLFFPKLNKMINLHEQFLHSLQNPRETVAHVFDSFLPKLQDIYSAYYINHVRAWKVHKRLAQTSSFQNLLANCQRFVEEEPNFKEKPIVHYESFSILPIQRLPRYEMLLKGLEQSSENESERKMYAQQHALMKKTNEFLNEEQSKAENVMKIGEIQSLLVGSSQKLGYAFSLFDKLPLRKFLLEGRLHVKVKHSWRGSGNTDPTSPVDYFFLFDDLLLHTKKPMDKGTDLFYEFVAVYYHVDNIESIKAGIMHKWEENIAMADTREKEVKLRPSVSMQSIFCSEYKRVLDLYGFDSPRVIVPPRNINDSGSISTSTSTSTNTSSNTQHTRPVSPLAASESQSSPTVGTVTTPLTPTGFTGSLVQRFPPPGHPMHAHMMDNPGGRRITTSASSPNVTAPNNV
eukprot:TRINITY_DN3699_c0_g2_i1.p1 TRINITY_DN3699_c0_g2~~TRINITY_DN3699_c0_g2_i1.p1  ORF type:complete len:1088 (+),score=226.00 TRINITY_DN3699_c0_g2_i1:235-3498(+)